jgi:hypothetical protein
MPAPVTLTGLFGAPVEAFANLLANVAAFHTFTGTASAILAKQRIYSILEAESGVTRPLALLTYQGGDWSSERDSASSGNASFKRDSSLTLLFEKDVTSTGYTSDAIKTFSNEIGDVIKGIMDKSGTDSLMLVNRITLAGFYSGKEGEEKILYAEFKITWGI